MKIIRTKLGLNLFTLAGILFWSTTFSKAAQTNKLETLYPFIRDGKWGFINAAGSWIIEPRFDYCREVFDKEYIRILQDKRWGYLDRTGKWIVESQFTLPWHGFGNAKYEVVSIGEKRGILERSDNLLLPVKYDEILIVDDRAWVRSEKQLGVFSLRGHWILKPSIPWPRERQMPIPTQNDVLWFIHQDKWGVLSKEGEILFKPQFDSHIMGSRESEGWQHPEGLDFKNGRAWVVADKNYWLITSDGKILTKQPFKKIKTWSDNIYIFIDQNDKLGLVSRDGKILLEAQFQHIYPPKEGKAIAVKHFKIKLKNGDLDDDWSYHCINEDGKIMVFSNTYIWRGSEFSEGLASVENISPNNIWNPYVGYIDKNGSIVIPLQFLQGEPFSEGLAAVLEAKRKPRLSPDSGLWGYIDKNGAMIIPFKFGYTKPFYRGRAWVLRAGSEYNKPEWAMIDQTGKVLTDYVYYPPEAKAYLKPIEEARWRGNFVTLKRSDFETGLATADGKVVVEPIFNRITEFRNGFALGYKQDKSKKDFQWTLSLINDRGQILTQGEYTEITDFDNGVAWATRRWTDHRGPYQNDGWGLIDKSANKLSDFKYVKAQWIWKFGTNYSDYHQPGFYENLAPIALAKNYNVYADKAWLENSWGYMNRKGKIVVWHEGVRNK